MTKKKIEKKEEDSKPVDRFAAAREKRRQAHEAKNSTNSGVDKSREEFRKFFIKVKSKLGLEKSMEQVIWTHFKAAGFDKKEKFEDGIKHFGYNL